MDKVSYIVTVTALVTKELLLREFPLDVILLILRYFNVDNEYYQSVLESNNREFGEETYQSKQFDNVCNVCGLYLNRFNDDDIQDEGNLYFRDETLPIYSMLLCFHCMERKYDYRLYDDNTYELASKRDPIKCISFSSANSYVQSKYCCIYMDHCDGFTNINEDCDEYPHLALILCSYCYVENCDHNYDDYDGICKCVNCGKVE